MDNFDDNIQLLIKEYFEYSQKNIPHFFDPDDYVDIIEYFIDNDMMPHARQAIAHAEKKYPDQEIILDKKAEILFAEPQGYPKALKVLLSIPDPQESMTFGMIAECYVHLKKIDLAIQYFDTLLLKTDNDLLHDTIIDIANILTDNEYYQQSLKYTEMGINLFPDDSTFLLLKSAALADSGNIDEALSICNSLIDRDPYLHEVWSLMATIYMNTDHLTDAIRCFDYLLAITPDDTDALRLKGFCHYRLDDYSSAITTLEKYCTSVTDDYQTLLTLAFCHMHDNPSRAKQLFLTIIDNYPIYPEAFTGYAEYLYYDQSPKEALEVINRASLLFPNDTIIRYFKAKYTLDITPSTDINTILQCIDKLNACIDDQPKHATFHYTIATAYIKINQIAQAYKHFTIAYSNGYTQDNIFVYLSIAAWILTDNDMFVKYYHEAISHYSNAHTLIANIIPDAITYLDSLEKS